VLYVRNLPYKITAEEMYDIFGKYGPIRQIRVGNKQETRGTVGDVSKRALILTPTMPRQSFGHSHSVCSHTQWLLSSPSLPLTSPHPGLSMSLGRTRTVPLSANNHTCLSRCLDATIGG